MRYFHEGNPLLNADTVRVTVFFLRNNFSIIQIADIPVEILEVPSVTNLTDTTPPGNASVVHSRISGPMEVTVGNIKAIGPAVGPSVMHIE